MKYLLCLLVLLTSAFSQKYPRPYVFGGGIFLPSGYSPAAPLVGAGMSYEPGKIMFDVSSEYDKEHKLGLSSYGRRLYGTAGYRITSNAYLLFGARWSELSTPEYSKSQWRFQGGAGYDWSIARGEAVYFAPAINPSTNISGVRCRDCDNSQGLQINFTLPSPRTARHLFFRERFTYFRYRDQSVTGNTSALELTLMYRF